MLSAANIAKYEDLTESAKLLCTIHCGNRRKRRNRKAIKQAVGWYCKNYLDNPSAYSDESNPTSECGRKIFRLLVCMEQVQ